VASDLFSAELSRSMSPGGGTGGLIFQSLGYHSSYFVFACMYTIPGLVSYRVCKPSTGYELFLS
jgi:hypothetical protein